MSLNQYLYLLDGMLIEKLLPNPQYRYGANNAENEVGKIALAKQLNVQQTADDGTGIYATPPEGRLIR